MLDITVHKNMHVQSAHKNVPKQTTSERNKEEEKTTIKLQNVFDDTKKKPHTNTFLHTLVEE